MGKVVSMLIFLLSALIATITPVLLAHRVASSKNKSRRGQVITASCNSLAGESRTNIKVTLVSVYGVMSMVSRRL